jgi:DNA transformation protein
MREDEGFLEWLRELLEPAGRVAFRRMFGGHGVYLDGLFVAIVIEGRPYLKADAETDPAFRAAGCAPFVYESRGKPVPMSYWSVPESALDSAEDMAPWARRAIAAALRKPATKAAKKAAVKDAKKVAARTPAKRLAKLPLKPDRSAPSASKAR